MYGFPDNVTQSTLVIGNLEWQLATAAENDGLSTGLTWNYGQLNWDNATSYCEGLDLSGQQDWRLPDKDNLTSLLDTSVSAPKIVAELRDTTQSSGYWSSTIHAGSASLAWFVYFLNAGVDGYYKTHSYYVRCVRDYDPNSQNTAIGVDNHTYQEIFRGDTQHTVTEGTNSLNLRLSPLLDDRELTVPRITRINRPFQMLASTSDNITVAVDTVKKDGSSAVDATLSYRFRSVDNESLPLDNITGGSFSPGEGDVTKSGSSYPDILSTYTAPDNDSTMKLQVRVSNELEIGVTSHFNVYVTDDIQTQNTVDTNPVIENISAERLDNGDLKWTMNVSNDDGFTGLMVKWEYLFGDNRTFTSQSNTSTQGDSNRGVMEATMSGYQDTDEGMLLVTVCEDGGTGGIPSDCAYMNEASTSISMELISGAYNKPIICDGDFCSYSIKVGILLGYTGPVANLVDDMANAAKLALNEASNSGWLLGSNTIEIVEADSTCVDSDQATFAADNLSGINNIVGIIGAACSGTTTAIINNVIAPKGIPMISPSATSPDLSTINDNDSFFRTAISDSRQAKLMAEITINRGIDEVIIAYTNVENMQKFKDYFQEFYIELGGNITTFIPHNHDQTDFTNELITINNIDNVSLVLLGYSGEAATLFLQAVLDNGGINNFILSDGILRSSLFENINGDLSGSFGLVPGTDSNGSSAFADLLTNNSVIDKDSPYIGESYDAAALLVLALQAANSTNRSLIASKIIEVANSPGEEILPGEISKGLELIAKGFDIDYEGVNNVELNSVGDAYGLFKEIEIQEKEFKTIKYHSSNPDNNSVN